MRNLVGWRLWKFTDSGDFIFSSAAFDSFVSSGSNETGFVWKINLHGVIVHSSEKNL